MKHNSTYSRKFARRKRGGSIHYQMPVDKDGNATLNEHDFVYRGGERLQKSFKRVKRYDEV